MKKTILTFSVLTLLTGTLFSQGIESGRSTAKTPDKVEVVKPMPVINNFVSDQDDPNISKQLITEDLYVQGSLGIGVDIVNGESFGFNTLILKENNLRILFDDSSDPSGTFPSNDWLMEANSTINGGENYFAIQDVTAITYPFKVMAGAMSNSIHIKNNGNIGLGTDNALVKLHLLYGDTPAIRLQQDNSSGWSPSTWDIAGNEANFFIRDVENGSNLPFRIQPAAPTSSLTIKATGNVGIGTWEPTEKLDVKGNILLDSVLRITPSIMESFEAREGDMYMDATNHMLKLYNGTEWISWAHIQDLSLNDNILSISGSESTVNFSAYMDNTDEQTLTLQGNSVSISNGNEIDLSAYMDNTDEQTLSLEGSTISISNGNEIDLSVLLIEQQSQIDELKQAIIELQEIISTMSTGVKDMSSELNNSSIDQNIPNPFTVSTNISYNIDQDVNKAYIAIYSEQGQLLEKIEIHERGEGSYTYVLNDATAKLFFYSLYADDVRITTKKMIVAY